MSKRKIIAKAFPSTKRTNSSLSGKIKNPELQSILNNIPEANFNWNIKEAVNHLVTSDERFIKVITDHGIPDHYLKTSNMLNSDDYFLELIKIIIYQQLAPTAAEKIAERFFDSIKLKGNQLVTPDIILKLKFEVDIIDGKRKILLFGNPTGLSEAKSKYIKSLAEHFNDPTKLKDVDLNALSDSELVEKLTAVNGLGLWTVHMFVIFNLKRSNVLAYGDLGIRNGITSFYGLPKKYLEGKSNIKEIESLCSNWAPYSSLACSLMWKIADKDKKK